MRHFFVKTSQTSKSIIFSLMALFTLALVGLGGVSADSDPDPAPVDCSGYWSDITSCSNKCGTGTKEQTFKITQLPANGGTSCPSSPRTVGCSDYSSCPMPQPDLVSVSLTMTSGTLDVGETITIEGKIKNIGNTKTGVGFSNQLRYALDSGPWNDISQLLSPSLDISAYDINSATLVIPDSVGALLRVQYCADLPLNEIGELDESNNCQVVDLGKIKGAPTLTFSASETTIIAPDSTELTWTVGGTADSCTASGGWSGPKLTKGDTETVSPAVTTTYILECWNSGVSSGEKSVKVTVDPPPAVNYDLNISLAGEASTIGTVILNPNPGANCTSNCTRTYAEGSTVTLTGNITNGSVSFMGHPDCIASTCTDLPMTTNLSVTADFACNSGYTWDGASCGMAPVDLAAGIPLANEIGATIVNSGIDGTYDDVRARLTINNVGAGNLPTDSAISYRTVLDGPTYSTIGTFNESLISGQSSLPLTQIFDGVMFGNNNVCARVNLDPTSYAESGLGNNENCRPFSLPVPRPPMSLTSDKHFIRSGETAIITWSVQTSYPITCSVAGPQLTEVTFDPFVDFGGIYTSSDTVGPLSNTGTFRLRCVEPSTGESHEARVIIEVIPDYRMI